MKGTRSRNVCTYGTYVSARWFGANVCVVPMVLGDKDVPVSLQKIAYVCARRLAVVVLDVDAAKGVLRKIKPAQDLVLGSLGVKRQVLDEARRAGVTQQVQQRDGRDPDCGVAGQDSLFLQVKVLRNSRK